LSILEKREEADSLKKNLDYEGASKIYSELWEAEKDKWDGWNAAHCFNKVKKYKQGYSFSLEVYKRNEDFDYIKREFVISAYYFLIKGYSGDLKVLKKYAQAIITSTRDMEENVFRHQTVLFVMKCCEKESEWSSLLAWSKKIDKSYLSKDSYSTTDKKGKKISIPSNLSSWYSKTTKAFEKLENWSECLSLCQEALSDFPDDAWFLYRKAKSVSRLGDLDLSLEIFKDVLKRKKEWFVYSEIAKIYIKFKNYKEAQKMFVDGFIASEKIPNIAYRWKIYYDAARCFEKMGNRDLSKMHLELALGLLVENEWKVKSEMRDFARSIDLDLEKIKKSKKVFKKLKNEWKKAKYFDQDRKRGFVKVILPNNKAGFISSGTKDYFFKISSVGIGQKVLEGSSISFFLEEGFDKKKNKPTKVAVEIKVEK